MEKQMVAAGTGAVAKAGIFAINLEEKIAEFKAANKAFAGLEVDMGTALKLTKKGKFQAADSEDVVFDSLTCVILQGQPQIHLWGKEGTPDDNKLLINTDSMEKALDEFEKLSQDPVFAELYKKEDINDRYVATIVNEDGNIYALQLSKTSKIEFGNYAKNLYTQKAAGLSDVITEITSEEKKSGKFEWIGLKFTCKGVIPKAEPVAEEIKEAEEVGANE